MLSPVLQRQVDTLLTSHSDLQSFMCEMNPSLQLTCAQHEDRAFFGTAPTLIALRCAYHDNAASMWLMPQLFDLGEYCGCREKMDEVQMSQLANIIVNEFGFLKVSEIMLFIYRLKAGRYGKFYGAIDPLLIITALRYNFMNERAVAIERRESAEREAEWEAHCRQVAKERAEARAAGRPMYPRMVTDRGKP